MNDHRTVIERSGAKFQVVSADLPARQSEQDRKTAKEANKKLGYRWLDKTMSRLEGGPLLRALFELEIDVLVTKEVDRYKKSIEQKSKAEVENLEIETNSLLDDYKWLIPSFGSFSEPKNQHQELALADREESAYWFFGPFCCIPGILSLLSCLGCLFNLHSLSAALLLAVLSLLSFVCAHYCFQKIRKAPSIRKGYFKEFESKKEQLLERASKAKALRWKVQDLKGYDREIPEAVVEKALRVNERFPEARFLIHELQSQEVHIELDLKKRIANFEKLMRNPIPDPFLEVRHIDKETGLQENYFIAVWDERDFHYSALNDMFEEE